MDHLKELCTWSPFECCPYWLKYCYFNVISKSCQKHHNWSHDRLALCVYVSVFHCLQLNNSVLGTTTFNGIQGTQVHFSIWKYFIHYIHIYLIIQSNLWVRKNMSNSVIWEVLCKIVQRTEKQWKNNLSFYVFF